MVEKPNPYKAKIFSQYSALIKDLKAIEEGINLVWNQQLDYIFIDKNLIQDTNILSFDSKFLYLWTKPPNPFLQKIPHQIIFSQTDQYGWKAGLIDRKIYKYLPPKIKNNFIICGSLLAPFISSHKNIKFDAYSTKESFLATIVHEFAHVYYRHYLYKNFYSKNNNLKNLNTVLKLFNQEKIDLTNFSIAFPPHDFVGEIFAFCADYSAAKLFFPQYQKNLDLMCRNYIQENIKKEKIRQENSFIPVFELDNFGHLSSMTLGRLLFDKYPKTWPQKLLNLQKLSK